jgi:hypothetical protein
MRNPVDRRATWMRPRKQRKTPAPAWSTYGSSPSTVSGDASITRILGMGGALAQQGSRAAS